MLGDDKDDKDELNKENLMYDELKQDQKLVNEIEQMPENIYSE